MAKCFWNLLTGKLFFSELQYEDNVMDSLPVYTCFLYFILFNRMDKFFDRMADDLETYAVHAKRKTIEVEDAELLLKRYVCCVHAVS